MNMVIYSVALLLLTLAPRLVTSSTGGNCENVCNYQIDNYWEPCLQENCPQIGALCQPRNATTCVCSKDCQMCVDDLYRECGGCTSKNGYDFDKDHAAKYKSMAEDMGCSSGLVVRPMIILSLVSLLTCTALVL